MQASHRSEVSTWDDTVFVAVYSQVFGDHGTVTRTHKEHLGMEVGGSTLNGIQKTNTILSGETNLGFFENGLETKLFVDAGPNGLGLV